MKWSLFALCLPGLAVLPASAEEASADIAVWDIGFYSAPPAAIKNAAFLMTIFDGNVVYHGSEFQ